MDGGLYELTYVPASRGSFLLHVVCARDVEGDATPVLSDVSSFFPLPLEIAPLGPDAAMSVLLNAERWHAATLGAGTRLLLLVHLRDRFGNACSWSSDQPDEEPPATPAVLQLDAGAGGHAAGALEARMDMSGVALSAYEARPHWLRLAPRDENFGQYEARHTLSHAGRFVVTLTLAGKPIGGSPLKFTVAPARAAGLKTRLFLPAAAADPKKEAAERQEAPIETGAAEEAKSGEWWETLHEGRGSPTNFKAASGKGSPTPSGGDHGTPDVAGATLRACLVSQLYRMQLRARDAFGNTVYRGGSKVEVGVVEPPIEAGSEYDHVLAPKLECVVHDIENGVYHIDMTAARPGMHSLTVRLDGAEVIGSPLSIHATKARVLASMKAAGKSRGETLYAVGAAIANAGINWAFKHWAELAYERRDKLDMLAAVARKLRNMDVLYGWVLWLEFAEDHVERVRKLDVALRALRTQWESRGFNAWIDFVQSRMRNRELLVRTLGAITSQALHAAFNTWFANLYPDKARAPTAAMVVELEEEAGPAA